ncbi:MAG: DCC1-like thiol-disulfide oxidoreductase family protein [Bacteroidota bacterium]|nr:DCC1-like thiol-disulfide oxidoreductase family protein [Bacteroidota bacterium]MDX5446889.1 DCC1-like thiol-disulfide oxidoreductase family protein [Bacteroidota bacterium]MDX5506373.1 DCC1-like thiol-disulfide oxidoreductase family protein [Bacteroidota bacterium]
MNIVLFDGVCNLCNRTVRLIYKNDRRSKFAFAPLTGDAGRSLIERYSIDTSADTVVLIQDGTVFTKSDAALRIAKELRFPFPILYPLVLLPRSLRDSVYDWIARNRYNWFGKRDVCMIPEGEWKSRFLE